MSLDEIGPYRIERLVGRGGMGRVYLARDWDTEERVAVKLLAPTLQDEAAFRERFEAEIETLKQLSHPNIVKLLAYGEQEGQLYYAMEYVAGITLQVELADKRHFTWQEVVNIGIQVCAALKHAHDRGIVHRDLKPANLLISPDHQIKLLDFGIAKLFGAAHLTVDGGVIGTADYMSPEQAESRGATPLSDLYSLGGVMYALLAGRPPFASKTVAECLHRLRYEKPAEIRRVAPGTPAELELILSQLLEKDPKKRVPTAIALANRLKSLEFALGHSEAKSQEGTSLPELMSDQPTDPAEGGEVDHDGETRDAASFTHGGTSSSAEFQVGQGAAESNLDISDMPLVAEPEPARPQSRATHFTTVVSETGRKSALTVGDDEDRVGAWAKVGMLVVLIGVTIYSIYAFISMPPSKERMFTEIKEAMDSTDKDAKLHVLATARQFLTDFPDDERVAEVEKYIREIRAHQFHARMERKIKFREDISELSAIELDYLNAIRERATDPERALSKLRALLDAYLGTDEDGVIQKATLRAAEDQVRQLKAAITERRERQVTALQKNLERGVNLKKTAPADARRIFSGIIALHADSLWAADIVQQARQELQKLRSEKK